MHGAPARTAHSRTTQQQDRSNTRRYLVAHIAKKNNSREKS
jgi:hypothetical protein